MASIFAYDHAMLSSQRAIKEAASRGDSPIQEFYKGRVVFVTGGSGFMGKLLIEKLLRTCAPSKIYVLIRHKKNKTPEGRMAEVLNDPLFDELRKVQSDFDTKIFPVPGDVSEINLGMEDLDWKRLIKEVNVIFHLAANVRFDVQLKTALLSNARGTREALCLARDCTHLHAFVYVSTAYAHATRERIDGTVFEVFYDVPLPPDTILNLAETLSHEKLNEMKPIIAGDWPNTYTFSKAIAEEIIRTNSVNLPISIVRPTIVTCTYLDPVPGWVDISCAYGTSGLILGVGLGVMHTIYMDSEVKPSFVPADIVNNSLIVTAWATAQQTNGRGDLPMIYTISSARNPISYGTLEVELSKRNVATSKAIWYNYCIATKYTFIYRILTVFLHYIPACIMDVGLLLLGKPRMLVKLYKKVDKMAFALRYFTTSQWVFKDDNVQSLFEKLSPADKLIFDMDIRGVNWQNKIHFWCLGIRKYLVKDTEDSMKPAYRKQRVFRIIHYLSYFLFLYLIWKSIQFCFNIFFGSNDFS